MRANAAVHLVRRFFWSLSGAEPDPADEQWLIGQLSERETHLYRMMSNQDRRHAIECGREADRLLDGQASPEIIVASALHDVGKTPARLGTVGRAVATILKPIFKPLSPLNDERWIDKTHVFGRMRRYADHSAIGADLLRGAGSEALVVAWAAEHHLPVDQWTIDHELGFVLAEADGEPRR